jgi:hypothetical protein
MNRLQNGPLALDIDPPIELLRDSPWQMSYGERAALEGLLSQRQPALAVEIGTAEGGSLERIALHSREVHSFDLVEPEPAARALENVTFHSGDSHVLLPQMLAEFAASDRVVDFVLVDGDHSSEGVRRDIEDLLNSPATSDTLIVIHDTMNEVVRAGLEQVEFEAWPKVAYVELDFVPGYMFLEESLLGELWGGLGLVVSKVGPKPIGGRARQSRYFDAHDLFMRGRDDTLARIEHGRRLATLSREIPEDSDEFVDPAAERDRLLAELHDANARYEHLRHYWVRVMESVSWRLTRPLRDVKARFKRLIS